MGELPIGEMLKLGGGYTLAAVFAWAWLRSESKRSALIEKLLSLSSQQSGAMGELNEVMRSLGDTIKERTAFIETLIRERR